MSTRSVACPFVATAGVRGWSVATITWACGVSSFCVMPAGAGGFWARRPETSSSANEIPSAMVRMRQSPPFDLTPKPGDILHLVRRPVPTECQAPGTGLSDGVGLDAVRLGCGILLSIDGVARRARPGDSLGGGAKR